MRQNKSIFVVDDNEVMLSTIRRSFQAAGVVSVYYYSDSYTFRDGFNKDAEIVVLDHQLENKTQGFDLLQFIKSHNPDCDIYIITASASANVIARYSGTVRRVILKKEGWINELIAILKAPKKRSIVQRIKVWLSLALGLLKQFLNKDE